ncbi:hypothetical protein [Microbacterium timonense]|uniref:hypothetical protein n=1 Tax=Microbacterium timonense TaxID=2086576 RepID=UPI00190EAB82|nr:hypothetical protein [Microbacterium timonense]
MRTAITSLALLGILLTGCAVQTETTSSGTGGPTESQPIEAPAEPLDLTGEWKQTNSNSADSYQAATITDSTITVDWVNEQDSARALYWAGTFEPPTEDTTHYEWDSVNDKAQTDTALMASGDDTKTFTYSDGVLSYELTAMGVTMTVEMERQ